MTRQSVPLGRIFGIAISLDYSWFLIFALMTWMLAKSYYPAEFKGWWPAEYWGVAALTTVMLFVSVLLHELGHSAVALSYGIPVRRINLFIFGGVSEIGGEDQRRGRVSHRCRGTDGQPDSWLYLSATGKFSPGNRAPFRHHQVSRVHQLRPFLFQPYPRISSWTAGASFERSSGASPAACAGPR